MIAYTTNFIKLITKLKISYKQQKKYATKEVTNFMARYTKFQIILYATNNKNGIKKINDCSIKNLDTILLIKTYIG